MGEYAPLLPFNEKQSRSGEFLFTEVRQYPCDFSIIPYTPVSAQDGIWESSSPPAQ